MNHRLCFTFRFTTRCLKNASPESYKNTSHPGWFAFFQENTVISFNISEIQLLFLFSKVIRGDGFCEKLIHKNPNKYWLMQKLVLLCFGLSNGL